MKKSDFFYSRGVADGESRDRFAKGKNEGATRGREEKRRRLKNQRERKKRNRDITFARYRLIGITRFSIVSESVATPPPPPFVAHRLFVESLIPRLG